MAQICTKSLVGWGFAPDPIGELTALPRHPSWFRVGPRGKGRRDGRGKEGGRERRGGSPGIPKSRVGKRKPGLALSVVYLSIFYCIVVYYRLFLCIVNFPCHVMSFGVLVVISTYQVIG